ncbi:unnamed protein product, partial [Discosporangium mesarthrocarpum]
MQENVPVEGALPVQYYSSLGGTAGGIAAAGPEPRGGGVESAGALVCGAGWDPAPLTEVPVADPGAGFRKRVGEGGVRSEGQPPLKRMTLKCKPAPPSVTAPGGSVGGGVSAANEPQPCTTDRRARDAPTIPLPQPSCNSGNSDGSNNNPPVAMDCCGPLHAVTKGASGSSGTVPTLPAISSAVGQEFHGVPTLPPSPPALPILDPRPSTTCSSSSSSFFSGLGNRSSFLMPPSSPLLSLEISGDSESHTRRPVRVPVGANRAFSSMGGVPSTESK